MTEFILKGIPTRPHGLSRACLDQDFFIDMLNCSGSTLRLLNLSNRLDDIKFESLLLALPNQVTLIISHSNPIPGAIFDMMIQGEMLQKLRHLDCFTPSPMSFLRLMDHHYGGIAHEHHQGLTCAHVYYKAAEAKKELNELRGVYERLRPRLESGEKEIVFSQITVV